MFLTPYRQKSLFDEFFQDFDNFVRPSFSGVTTLTKDDVHSVSIDVPGFAKEDITIDIHEGILSIQGEKAIGESQREISRRFSIPDAIDIENISATVENGILTINLPKSAISTKRTIQIT